MLSLKKVLKNVRKELKVKNRLREKMLVNARRIGQLSKEAIILIHHQNPDKAQKRLNEANQLLQRTLKILEPAAELHSSGALFNACQEYAEGAILLSLENGVYPTPESVSIPPSVYVLGLGDVVGELRRKAVNSLKNDDVEAAESYVQQMDDIYSELMTLNENVFAVLPALRRKCDVARHLIELTGSDVILERRQKRLEESLKILEQQGVKRKREKSLKIQSITKLG